MFMYNVIIMRCEKEWRTAPLVPISGFPINFIVIPRNNIVSMDFSISEKHHRTPKLLT